MHERILTFGAIGVAVVATGSLFLLSRRHQANLYAPKIISLREVKGTLSRPPSVEIAFDNAKALSHWTQDESAQLSYRIRDAANRNYAVQTSDDGDGEKKILIPLGYAKPIREPRLEIVSEKGTLSSTPIDALPVPTLHPLEPDALPRLRAFAMPSGQLPPQLDPLKLRRSAIRFEPIAPFAAGEAWSIEVLETPTQERPISTSLQLPGPLGNTPVFLVPAPHGILAAQYNKKELRTEANWVLSFPYADEATAVKVKVTRQVPATQEQIVTIHGLRLVSGHGPASVAGDKQSIPNALDLDIAFSAIPKKALPLPAINHVRGLVMIQSHVPGPNDPTIVGNLSIRPSNQGRFSASWVEGSVLSPTPEALRAHALGLGWLLYPDQGVDSFRPGSQFFRTHLLRRASSLGDILPIGPGQPFDVKVRLTKHYLRTVETFQTTIPVERQGK